MRLLALSAIVVLLANASLNYCWGQRGIPVVRPPAIRPTPIPHPVHVPIHGSGSRDAESGTDWVPIVLGVGGVAGLAGMGFLGVWAWKRRASAAMRIRIVRIPAGEAPENIRREWVGVELRLSHGEKGPRPMPSVGVISNAWPQVTVGYMVDGKKAVDQLATYSSSAADWWRTNAPHVLAAGYKLQFAAEDCELVEK